MDHRLKYSLRCGEKLRVYKRWTAERQKLRSSSGPQAVFRDGQCRRFSGGEEVGVDGAQGAKVGGGEYNIISSVLISFMLQNAFNERIFVEQRVPIW